ncbi:MAG TPA: hypothetical protein VGW75_14030 [Solirubrobacteraceae bacterium]|jgi:hypothetical protein|nr:hypothetical protein [Solirubrobacteraceae bacterium]
MRRELDEDALRHLFDHARESPTAAEVEAVLARLATRRRRRPRPLRLAVAAAVATAAAGVVLVAGGTPRQSRPPSASAAEVLRRAASAPHGPDVLPPGSYAYLRYRYTAAAAGGAPGDHGTFERWVRRDGRGLTVVRHSAAWARAAGDGIERTRTAASTTPFAVGARSWSYRELRRLAGSPRRVDRLVSDAARTLPGGDALSPADRTAYAAYAVLRDVLLAPAPVAVQQRTYLRLVGHPALRLVARTPTAATVAADAGDLRFQLEVDAATGELLSLERRLLRRSRRFPGRPRVVNRIEVVARGITRSPGARP